jgi:transposase
MMRMVGSDLGEQTAVLPVDIRQVLGSDHPAFEFVETARELDMAPFEAAYRADGVGRSPYDPRWMVALLLYLRWKGQHTPRQVAAACRDDLGARAIMGGSCPDERTVRRFQEVHEVALRGLLVQSIRLGEGYGLVDTNVVAGDGTFMTANASMQANRTEEQLVASIDELKRKVVEAQTAYWDSVDPATVAYAPALFAADGGEVVEESARVSAPGDPVAFRRLRSLELKLYRHETALSHLRAHPNRDMQQWQDRLDRDQQRVERDEQRAEAVHADLRAQHERRQARVAAGERISGTPPVPVQEHTRTRAAERALATAKARAEATAAARPTTGRINITDPTSAIMPGKKGDFDQRHNVQATACGDEFILAIGLHPSTNDKQALIELLRQTRANLDDAGIRRAIIHALFDAGYASEANFTADLPVDTLLVAVQKEARQTGRQTDQAASTPAAWDTMRTRLQQQANRLLYKLRSGIIEPVFAQMFNLFGRAIRSRGQAALTELHLSATTHNLLKIHRARRAATKAQPAILATT